MSKSVVYASQSENFFLMNLTDSDLRISYSEISFFNALKNSFENIYSVINTWSCNITLISNKFINNIGRLGGLLYSNFNDAETTLYAKI